MIKLTYMVLSMLVIGVLGAVAPDTLSVVEAPSQILRMGMVPSTGEKVIVTLTNVVPQSIVCYKMNTGGMWIQSSDFTLGRNLGLGNLNIKGLSVTNASIGITGAIKGRNVSDTLDTMFCLILNSQTLVQKALYIDSSLQEKNTLLPGGWILYRASRGLDICNNGTNFYILGFTRGLWNGNNSISHYITIWKLTQDGGYIGMRKFNTAYNPYSFAVSSLQITSMGWYVFTSIINSSSQLYLNAYADTATINKEVWVNRGAVKKMWEDTLPTWTVFSTNFPFLRLKNDTPMVAYTDSNYTKTTAKFIMYNKPVSGNPDLKVGYPKTFFTGIKDTVQVLGFAVNNEGYYFHGNKDSIKHTFWISRIGFDGVISYKGFFNSYPDSAGDVTSAENCGIISPTGEYSCQRTYSNRTPRIITFDRSGISALVPGNITFTSKKGKVGVTSAQSVVSISNSNCGLFGTLSSSIVYGPKGTGWLSVALSGSGNAQTATNTVTGYTGLDTGTYTATVTLRGGGLRVAVPTTYPVTLVISLDSGITSNSFYGVESSKDNFGVWMAQGKLSYGSNAGGCPWEVNVYNVSGRVIYRDGGSVGVVRQGIPVDISSGRFFVRLVQGDRVMGKWLSFIR